MKFHEKILYYRKRAKLSQEALAGQVGVSRQAVSKWELGEAMPEVDKLRALARAFGVTTDELLSEDDPAEAERPAPPSGVPKEDSSRLPGWLNRMTRRWGWLAGVYLALIGLGFTLMGALTLYRSIWSVWALLGPEGLEDPGFWYITLPLIVILVFGLVLLITGVVLAAVLHRKGRKNH